MRIYIKNIRAIALGLSVSAALCACSSLKGAGNGHSDAVAEPVLEGAQHVIDGSGDRVNDAAQECINLGSGTAAGCAATNAAAGPTTNAPAPTIAEPAAAPPPQSTAEAAIQPPAEPAVAPAIEPAPAVKKLEISRGEVVTAAPKLEELSLQAEALFKFGKSDTANLLPAARTQLDQLAQRISQLGAASISKITITGHADRLGLDADNQILSRRRAETVQRYLASKAVPATLLQAYAKGESEPIVNCSGDRPTAKLKACLAPNRRVDVVVYGRE